ncbi:MAG TPA: signal peptidase I [Anaerolineales bacterium]|nr:signal peptidase I [Anaerolineales bacterium]
MNLVAREGLLRGERKEVWSLADQGWLGPEGQSAVDGGSATPGFSAERPRFAGRLLRALGEVLQTLLIAGILFLAVNLVTARVRVESISMEPSLYEGELVVVSRLAYRWREPQRGDIIVFRYPKDPTKRYIKRVIGLPGDQVSMSDGRVFVNGLPLEEPYIAANPSSSGEWVVEPGKVFVLGDNRNNSNDSRSWGALAISEIIGKAILVYWPPQNVGLIPHYDLASAGS